VQDTTTWTPPTGALGRLTKAAFERAAAIRGVVSELKARARDLVPPPSFSAAFGSRVTVGVIAELKRRSPSKGALNPGLQATARAREYVSGGASALSVLTEPEEFGGALGDLVEIRRVVAVPLLRKDFHVEEAQVWEGRVAGASAILLIARALEPSRLEALCGAIREAEMEPLLEVRTERELEAAIHLKAPLIGVNARDLETLAIDASTVDVLLPQIPADRIAIAESGIVAVGDVMRVAAKGADAVLVGSVLSGAPDGAGAVQALSGVPRRGRAA
jgi:indole-3-glycerol phosphate synthase